MDVCHVLVCTPGRRLDALRAQRLRSNPKEEQALLDSAKALSAIHTLSNGSVAVSAMEGAAEGSGNAAPDQAAGIPAQGRGGGRGRGRGRGRAKALKWVLKSSLHHWDNPIEPTVLLALPAKPQLLSHLLR